jgi:hypothetical protein
MGEEGGGEYVAGVDDPFKIQCGKVGGSEDERGADFRGLVSEFQFLS